MVFRSSGRAYFSLVGRKPSSWCHVGLVLVLGTAACDGEDAGRTPKRSSPSDASNEGAGDPDPEAKSGQAKSDPTTPDPTTPDPSKPEKATIPEPSPHFVGRAEIETTVSGEGDGPYRFTAWWHKSRAEEWERVVSPWAGIENLNYLEVGVFEGRSLLWMIENVLTHPSTTATAIDVFMDDYEATFDANIEASGASSRITKLKEPSQTALRRLPLESFDIIYIDGSHTADDVLADAVLSWDLLRPGGLIIFDDYQWNGRPHGGALPPELLPKIAIDTFVTAHRYELQMVSRGAQVMLRKLDNPCAVKDYCSPVGQYLYFWREHQLRTREGEDLTLSPQEIGMIESIAKSRRPGEVDVRLNRGIRNNEVFKAMTERLELDLRRRRAPAPAER